MNLDDEAFAEAVDLPVADRAAALDRACGNDAAMRARVEALLEAYDSAGNFLESPAVDRTAVRPQQNPGDVIGRYQLQRVIGEGGCGIVYLAEQREPVRRRVALKVIKLGMDTRSVIARFEAERQAVAMMNHPNIAQVFDAGATDTGRPYFVMEYVNGTPITKFCDDHSLPLAKRLELFVRVCLAMQHAHQKGIIHRDLKPSNILVALHDNAPVPKVIDFGIAKATQGRLTERTVYTGIEQFIGTPAYMSPEQADLRDLDIDTRSDVYSLGVVLYELLTGRLPFDPTTLAQAGVDEVRRVIREVGPARPSKSVATLAGPDRETVARLRGAAPVQLASELRGDLDWIVMRCLEKERDRRYGSAQELADDVLRYLGHEPVEARPPSASYRVRKFIARHRVACASAAAIALTLVVGTVVSIRQAVRATRAGRAEAVARADAQRRQEQAEDLLTFMLGDFRTELQKIGRLSLLDSVGEKAMAYFAGLDPRDLTDTALARQARALTQIGETRMAEARYTEASAAFTTAFDRASALAARHPRDGDMLFERAQAEYWIGFVARLRGDFPAARAWLTRYRDSAVSLVAIGAERLRAQRELASGYHNLAVLDFDRGDLAEAGRGFLAERSAVEEMLKSDPGGLELRSKMANVVSWIGLAAEGDGRYADAIRSFDESSSRYGKLAELEPAVARWRYELAETLTFTGEVQAITNRRGEASASFARARALIDLLAAQDPKNRQWEVTALGIRLKQVGLLLAEGNARTAAPILAESREKLERLFAAEPSSRAFAGLLAAALQFEGQMRLATRSPDAGDPVARAIELGEAFNHETNAHDWIFGEYAQACILAGRIAFVRADPDLARRDWNRALKVLGPTPENSRNWRLLDPAAQALALLGRAAEAHPLIERLRRFGYHSIDPLADSILDAASE